MFQRITKRHRPQWKIGDTTGLVPESMNLKYLEGKKFCVVFVKQTDENDPDSQISMKCLHGRANIDRHGKLNVEGPEFSFPVPATASKQIMPSDGTPMLKDAEFFVMCKVSGMDL